jgi:hypothetical protein
VTDDEDLTALRLRRCQCTCEAWGHPGVCDGRDVAEITVRTPNPEWDLWPAANKGTFKLCPPCYSALMGLPGRLWMWDANIEAFGYPTIEMLYAAEYERIRREWEREAEAAE